MKHEVYKRRKGVFDLPDFAGYIEADDSTKAYLKALEFYGEEGYQVEVRAEGAGYGYMGDRVRLAAEDRWT